MKNTISAYLQDHQANSIKIQRNNKFNNYNNLATVFCGNRSLGANQFQIGRRQTNMRMTHCLGV